MMGCLAKMYIGYYSYYRSSTVTSSGVGAAPLGRTNCDSSCQDCQW